MWPDTNVVVSHNTKCRARDLKRHLAMDRSAGHELAYCMFVLFNTKFERNDFQGELRVVRLDTTNFRVRLHEI